MLVTLEEAKEYLRIDGEYDDGLIDGLIATAQSLCLTILRQEEQDLDKYLDNASVAHLHQVRIIHGKGTGKLREGIHQYLRKSKYVTKFNLAGYGEGDYGVTIAYLK